MYVFSVCMKFIRMPKEISTNKIINEHTSIQRPKNHINIKEFMSRAWWRGCPFALLIRTELCRDLWSLLRRVCFEAVNVLMEV